MYECRIEIADVPVLIRCRFRENVDFLQAYWTQKAEHFAIMPTEMDLARMQADFDRMDEAEGIPKHKRTDRFLENNAIHSLLAKRLVEENVLLMHGSALCMDGEAYVFIAKSGTGKSTHARLWREVFGERVWMINDDKPMLKITGSGVWVYGTPWDGKHHLSRNASARLKAIVKLERDTFNHIEPIQKTDVFPMLMAQAFSMRDPATMAQMLALEKRLLNAADFYILGCNMEKDAAKVAWEGMCAEETSMKLKSDFITQDIDDTQFLIPVSAEAFNGILRSNSTAAFIVDCLKEETTMDAIVDKMCEQYDTSRAAITADVKEVLDTLRSIHALDEG